VSALVEYVEVPLAEVPYQSYELAETVKRLLCAKLGLRRHVRVRWFVDAAGHDSAGRETFRAIGPIVGCVRRTHPDTIWLRADLSPAGVIEATAHELRHLYQGQEWCDLFRFAALVGAQEADADAFAAEVRGWFGGRARRLPR
jgi:hypothetical protein